MAHVHLVSDSTGETLSSILRSVMTQFPDTRYEDHSWTLVRTNGQMERAIDGIKQNPGIVLYTIINEELQDLLVEACKRLGIPCFPVLSGIIKQMSRHFGIEAKGAVGRQYELDEAYFKRIEAINFALDHDDGQNTDTLEKADIVLVGVSRTSKTPTCVYLSYRGVNAANVPFVNGVPLPEKLFELKNPLVVGLVISPDRLIQIRKSRLLALNEQRDTDYVDLEAIKEEVVEARKIFSKEGWRVIDVTRKSIEETTAQIMQLYDAHVEEKENAS